MARSIRWLAVTISVLGVLLPSVGVRPLTAQGDRDTTPPKTNVFVHPEKLTEKDKLVDGPGDRVIEIKSETTLVWVDLMPDFRYAHPTEYVLISTEGARVVKGHWWPVLNGKALFRDAKEYKAAFPVKLTGK